MMQEVPVGEWCPSWRDSAAHIARGWRRFMLSTGGGALTRWRQVRLKSATHVVDAALFEFLDEGQSFCARRPCTLRIQQTDVGAVQALEIETLEGQFIRLAFRATAYQSSSTDSHQTRCTCLNDHADRVKRCKVGVQTVREYSLLHAEPELIARQSPRVPAECVWIVMQRRDSSSRSSQGSGALVRDWFRQRSSASDATRFRQTV